ncbi:hypothetical protein BB561_000938 [Smittium simulii]|uniref:Sodium/nucleoside cotransporter n=1 Tax=Smittium simulii TaxID=133385 RepID=A0A2T9YWV8_9FUNG|nr:hypothetical protein BB561_000938 [Smittium simulii]
MLPTHDFPSPHVSDSIEKPNDESKVQPQKSQLSILFQKFKLPIYLFIWVLLTVYLGFALGLKKRTQMSDILPLIFLYVFIFFKLAGSFVSFSFLSAAVNSFWDNVLMRAINMIPSRFRKYVYGVFLVVLFIVIGLTIPATVNGSRGSRLQSIFGIFVIITVFAITSKHRKHIAWHTVFTGQLLQLILGAIVLKTTAGLQFFKWISDVAGDFLGFSEEGAKFLFGPNVYKDFGNFALSVFPAIIFFVAFIQMVYYLGGMQWLVGRLSMFFTKLMDTSGSESVVAAACPFIGQGESAVLVSSYVEFMTKSELHAIMTSGFSTISGSVLSGYLSLNVDLAYLITSCIMSIPCSLALSKLRYPETEESLTKGQVVAPATEKTDINLLHAAGNGAALGMTLSLMIAASLIAIISILAFINNMLTWFGNFVGIAELTLNLIMGYCLYPLTWLLGIQKSDILTVSKLLGTKLVANEFVAYNILNSPISTDSSVILKSTLSSRSQVITQFALCGFANLSSVGIQIGAIGAIAPSRKADLAQLAFSAMITGFCATCVSAAIAGFLL